MYNRTANLGCTNSQINLAEMYRCGVEGVVNENIEEAFKWYKIAAGENRLSNVGALEELSAGAMKTVDNTLGNVLKFKALRLLFKYYRNGDCPEGRPQPTKAVYYLTRAAELGDAEAQLELGQIYLTGGCEQLKDVARARRWLQKASAHGDVRAKQLLEECLKQIVDTEHTASEVSEEAFLQTCDILKEKMKQRSESRLHPFAISQPVPLTEE
ncbi:unnamed protein product [Porites lobata]|uniref:Sel1 repeat-containing protein n=1 Tax=Porites lobata TaxID=104759 RepID=A0ABN8RQC5_9CNID|nr:unnamed protein product [Porites lobata]